MIGKIILMLIGVVIGFCLAAAILEPLFLTSMVHIAANDEIESIQFNLKNGTTIDVTNITKSATLFYETYKIESQLKSQQKQKNISV